jgi:hypothetical protein
MDRIQLMARLALLVAALGLLGLSGCSLSWVPPVAVAAAVEGVSLNQSGKTVSDHLSSLVTGSDCSILAYTKTGTYCRSAAEIAADEARRSRPYPGYCYRQRGGVACFTEPDPTATTELDIVPVTR